MNNSAELYVQRTTNDQLFIKYININYQFSIVISSVWSEYMMGQVESQKSERFLKF